MPPKLIPIKYHNRIYPKGINPKITELAAHFDTKGLSNVNTKISLHTEYSHSKRAFSSLSLNGLGTIKTSHKNNVPELWKDEQWAKEFVTFITSITKNCINKIKIIEIHPPFNNYCQTISDFLKIYSHFEQQILNLLPDVDLLLENRYGTNYPNGKFLISTTNDILNLASAINDNGLKLKLVIDFPQLLSAEVGQNITQQGINNIISPLSEIKDCIRGIHIWGKNPKPHHGDLNSLFNNNQPLKNHFLNELKNLLNDDIERYSVPEVNSNDKDLSSIVADFQKVGFQFK